MADTPSTKGGVALPRFFFDVREGADFIRDREGQVMADLEAAEEEAMRAAASMARDALPFGRTRSVTIEVSDGEHKPVFCVTVSMELKRL